MTIKKYSIKFEEPPLMQIECKEEEDIFNAVVNAWVMYSGYDLPDYSVIEEEE